MNLLLTNDDGWGAPGLEALAAVASKFGDVTIVAPAENCSWIGHRVTVGRPLTLKEHGKGLFSIDGTPADCVRVGIAALNINPTWVIAGINNGANLGIDLYHSGTAAAAREATCFGIPGLALSHYRAAGQPVHWGQAQDYLEHHLHSLLSTELEPHTFLNLNFPHSHGAQREQPPLKWVPLERGAHEIKFTQEGQRLTFAGRFDGRQRSPGGDVFECVNQGNITCSIVEVGAGRGG